ncbi:helix-turn-helix domain-containing protein [Patescibacteria group bacterium]|nr:helix-turn-helix domain-containing protein [Patescibacteria group bacterium]
MEEINPNEVYTTKETRDFLKVSESTLKRYLKKGIIRAHKIGGRYRILGSEILQLISPEVESKVYRVYKGFRDKTKKTIERW